MTEKDFQKIRDLAAQLSMGKSSLTALIDRMEHAGLVRRKRNRDDERISNLFILRTGRAIVGRTARAVKHLNAALLEPFSTEERSTIERFLLHMRENAPAMIAEHSVSAQRLRFKRAHLVALGAKPTFEETPPPWFSLRPKLRSSNIDVRQADFVELRRLQERSYFSVKINTAPLLRGRAEKLI